MYTTPMTTTLLPTEGSDIICQC